MPLAIDLQVNEQGQVQFVLTFILFNRQYHLSPPYRTFTTIKRLQDLFKKRRINFLITTTISLTNSHFYLYN